MRTENRLNVAYYRPVHIGLRNLALRVRLQLAYLRTRSPYGVGIPAVTSRQVFIALAADYGNLGDLAITTAQRRFLEEAFPDSIVTPIPISRTLSSLKGLQRSIGPDDVITLIGGGNTGDLYDDIQFLRELVVSKFPSTRIVSFPQTISFSETIYGRWAAKRAAAVYNNHPHLTIIARDTISHTIAQSLFKNANVVLAPDVVLQLDVPSSSSPRTKIVLSLRGDRERALGSHDRKRVADIASTFGEVLHKDTHVGDRRLTPQEAQDELRNAWETWSSAACVITDRLHGMIFAVITGTPCIALDSATGKVAQFYQDWLGHLSYIQLLSSTADTEVSRALATALSKPTPSQLERDELKFAVRQRLLAIVGESV